MDEARFKQLVEAARKAFTMRGDDLTARANARRQYQQTLDLLSLECDEMQWAKVRHEIARKWA